ncbi:MAG TPA: ATP-binding protein [Vicinamibacterales bacterium]
MIWAIAGLVYAGAYAALVSAFVGSPHLRLVIGNIAVLLPPIAPLFIILRNRRRWTGRQAVFWAAIATWSVLWLIGQIGWAFDEVIRDLRSPWFTWHLVVQLSGSAVPLIALVAWPHRRRAVDTAATAAIDIAVLIFLSGFLYWSLVVAPGTEPEHSRTALRLLAVIAPLVRILAILGFGLAALDAGKNAWADVYKRLALGMVLGLGGLIGWAVVASQGNFHTGTPGDIGSMLPFWFAAWAASAAPSSPVESRSAGTWAVRHSSPVLLFVGILIVPLVGYSLRYLMPAGAHVDRLRDLATAAALVCGTGLIMIRLRVEQRGVERANQGVRLLATACEQAGELIVILRQNRIEYANDAFCRACGYTREDVELLTPSALIGAESIAQLPTLTESLRAQRTVRATASIARKDGSTFQAACVATPLVNGAGQITHIVAVVRDTTEELRLREHLVRSERMSAIGEFVSGVAHELNNPLQSLIGTLELMLSEPHTPEVKVDLERAQTEAWRAGRIVRNLLTFIRRSPNERLLTGLNEIVQSTVGVRVYELEMAGIEVRMDLTSNLPLVLANREEIQQVVLNLVVNAQQAMSEANGRGVLSIRTFVDGDAAILEVCDDGPGIPAELVGRIFEPFFTTGLTGAGAGLGLSLSFGIAKAHAGALSLMPSTSGACFRLSLPGAGFPGPAPILPIPQVH